MNSSYKVVSALRLANRWSTSSKIAGGLSLEAARARARSLAETAYVRARSEATADQEVMLGGTAALNVWFLTTHHPAGGLLSVSIYMVEADIVDRDPA